MTKFIYKGRTLRDIQLRLLDIAIGADTYQSVLAALSNGIRRSIERINSAADEFGIVDYETDVIENMLGASFVVCQAQIAAVVAAATNIDGQTMTARQLFTLGPRFNKTYSQVEVLWEVANYFKHRDEWPRTIWSNPGNRKRTINTIKAAGLKGNSTGNLRQAANALGNGTFAKTDKFSGTIDAWSNDLRKQI